VNIHWYAKINAFALIVVLGRHAQVRLSMPYGFYGVFMRGFTIRKNTNDRRGKSWEIIRGHYHDRGWQSPYYRYEKLIGQLLQEGSTALDVGCGRHFPMGQHLMQYGAEIHGIDPVAEPESAVSGLTLQRASANRIPYKDEVFDVVMSRSVLEHLKQPTKVFHEFNRVLKPTGKVVFLAANKYDYVSIFASFLPNRFHNRIVNTIEGRDPENTFPTYYRASCLRQISRLALETGFSIETLEYLNQFPYTLLFSPTLCRIAIAYDDFIGRSRRLHFLRGWILGCLTKRNYRNV